MGEIDMRQSVSGKPAIILTDKQRARWDVLFWKAVILLVAFASFAWMMRFMWGLGYMRSSALARIVERICR
jgi:hypothetical protein